MLVVICFAIEIRTSNEEATLEPKDHVSRFFEKGNHCVIRGCVEWKKHFGLVRSRVWFLKLSQFGSQSGQYLVRLFPGKAASDRTKIKAALDVRCCVLELAAVTIRLNFFHCLSKILTSYQSRSNQPNQILLDGSLASFFASLVCGIAIVYQ